MSPAASTSRRRHEQKSRPPLTRERVLRVAMGLADRHGIESLSMRTLGQQLGVEAMSLYNHIQNKGDMLDGMVDIVFGQIELPSDDVDWRAAMRQRAISAHQVLLRHPWAVGFMESRLRPGPANLRHHDAVLGRLRKAGFPIAMAAHAYSVLDGYIYGFTLTELGLPFRGSEVVDVGRNMLSQFPIATYPYLAEMIEHAIRPGYTYEAEFEYGLDLILAGIARAKDSTAEPK